MKKRWIAAFIVLNMALLPTGCGSAESGESMVSEAPENAAGEGTEAEGAAEDKEEKEDANDSVQDIEIEDVLGDMTMDYSSAGGCCHYFQVMGCGGGGRDLYILSRRKR